MNTYLIVGAAGFALGIGAAWVVGGEDGIPLFVGGCLVGAAGFWAYSNFAG